MKKLALVVAVAVLALSLVPLAAAKPGGGWKHGKAKFNLVGEVVTVDATATDNAAGTVTIRVKAGTKTVRAFRGREAVMQVAVAAKVRMVTQEGVVAVTLGDVPAGGKIRARGIIDRTDPAAPVFTIRYLKVKAAAARPAPALTR